MISTGFSRGQAGNLFQHFKKAVCLARVNCLCIQP
jgi:hypothetical protein